MPALSNLMTSNSPTADVVGNLATTTNAHVDHITPQVHSQPQVTAPPPASPSSTMYTFQTCMAHQQDVDPAWDEFAGSQCFQQPPTSPVAVHAFCAQHFASSPVTFPLIL